MNVGSIGKHLGKSFQLLEYPHSRINFVVLSTLVLKCILQTLSTDKELIV